MITEMIIEMITNSSAITIAKIVESGKVVANIVSFVKLSCIVD